MTAPLGAPTDDAKWRAVLRRDRRFDGRFVYAVLTTGVYCRPSCPAKRPRPENVAFHDTTAAAEQAGYRACKRCRPALAEDPTTALVTRLCREIEASESPPSLRSLAATAGLSPFYLQRVFKRVTGVSPRDYARARQNQRLRDALRQEGSVTRAAHAAGIGSSSRLHTASRRLGLKPSSVQDGGVHLEVRFECAECSLGLVLVAETSRGVCAVLLGEGREQLQRELARTFPRARLCHASELAARLRQVVSAIDQGQSLELPLDVRGTAFQERVWQALQRIPSGETRTYRELAEEIGAPNASRAVGNACGQNRLAVLVPCHRVVHSDGSISGYRWGVERKRALLEREGQAATARGRRRR